MATTQTKTVTGNTTVSATTSLQSFTVTISAGSNQTITVKTNRGTYTSSFTAYYGDTYTASVAASSGYKAGTISSSSGTFKGATTISASNAVAINYKRVGGKIFYINSASNGATYTFYDSNGNVVSASVGSEPYYYSVSGTPTKDKYYVYYTTLNTAAKTWTFDEYYEYTEATGTAIGTGKSNTTIMLNNVWYTSDGSTIWYYIKRLRSNNTNGCNDWFVGSKEEVEKLRTSRLASSWFSYHSLCSSSGCGSNDAWLWNYNYSGWDIYSKYTIGQVVAFRAF